MEKTDVVILCGGLGTRLKKVVKNTPKPLAEINGIPFLDILLSWIEKNKTVGKVILAAGYLGHKINNKYLNSKFSFPIEVIIEDSPLGTGGAVRNSLNYIDTNNFIVLNGDSFIDESIDNINSYFNEKRSCITIVIKHSNNINRYGLIYIDKNNILKSFSEKDLSSKNGYINCGIYVMNKKWALTHLNENKFSLEERFQKLLPSQKASCFISKADFIDIGTVDSYHQSQTFFK